MTFLLHSSRHLLVELLKPPLLLLLDQLPFLSFFSLSPLSLSLSLSLIFFFFFLFFFSLCFSSTQNYLSFGFFCCCCFCCCCCSFVLPFLFHFLPITRQQPTYPKNKKEKKKIPSILLFFLFVFKNLFFFDCSPPSQHNTNQVLKGF